MKQKCPDCKSTESETVGFNVYWKKCGKWLNEADDNDKYETKCVVCREKFLAKKNTGLKDICDKCKEVI
jgi:phage FluMu protein Com